ncbi:FIST C-terminal domain-containing protein [Eubacteriales bacterium OttesenSCG-928-K08]|nr:FIST C-terminal domain-containing protein [Eubacteriales bacterium OttesenSCG-928-K08]
MIKMLTAHTYEIDDADVALKELLEQLNMENNLLKNSIGLLTCYAEFCDNELLELLSNALPFDFMGATTLANATGNEIGQMMLTLSVLTSDTLNFSAAFSEPLESDKIKDQLKVAYDSASAKLSGKPSAMLTTIPLFYDKANDDVVNILNDISGGIPIFGTIAVDHMPDYSLTRSIFNAQLSRNAICLLLIEGDFEPTFFMASVNNDKIFKQRDIITSSADNQLYEVNNMDVLSYIQSLGLAKDGVIEGVNSIPFMIDFNDGTPPVARAIFALTPEGHAICGGAMPEWATLSIASIDDDDVVSTAKDIVHQALSTGKRNGMILFSCIARNIALGLNQLSEIEAIQEEINGQLPFMMAYSGGEICPMYDNDGKIYNRFHNDTIVGIIF